MVIFLVVDLKEIWRYLVAPVCRTGKFGSFPSCHTLSSLSCIPVFFSSQIILFVACSDKTVRHMLHYRPLIHISISEG